MARTKKNKLNRIEHINSKININTSTNCNNCPMRLYTKDKHIVMGVGNIHSNYVFILPVYDDKTYETIIKILQEEFVKLKGKELFEIVYVTRIIKCFGSNDFDIRLSAVKYCSNVLNYELRHIKQKNIIVFGSVYDGLELYINNIPNIKNRNIIHIYDPIVMYYDNDKIRKNFLEQLDNAIIL